MECECCDMNESSIGIRKSEQFADITVGGVLSLHCHHFT